MSFKNSPPHSAAKSAKAITSPAAPFALLQNKHGATIFAVVIATAMAVVPPKAPPVALSAALDGKVTAEMEAAALKKKPSQSRVDKMKQGGWKDSSRGLAITRAKAVSHPLALFGATNQLLAGLSFMVISFYLWRRGRAIWFIVIPMLFMLVMPIWAMIYQLFVAPGWLVAGQVDYLRQHRLGHDRTRNLDDH